MKKNLIIAGVFVLLVGFFIWRSQPEQVLKRRSKSLIEMADQVSSGTSLFDVKRLEGLLAQRLRYQVDAVSPEADSANQVEVISGYQWMGENTQDSDFEIEEFTSIDINGDQARVKLRVDGVLEMNEMRMMAGIHLVEFGWRKHESGDWRLVDLVWK